MPEAENGHLRFLTLLIWTHAKLAPKALWKFRKSLARFKIRHYLNNEFDGAEYKNIY